MQEKENPDERNAERFESDTQRIIRRHLENEDDEITEDDIKNVRIGMNPPPDQIVPLDEEETDLSVNTNGKEDQNTEEHGQATPWDTLED